MSCDLDMDYQRRVCQKIVENSEVLSEEKLPTFSRLSDSLLDENVNITLIEGTVRGIILSNQNS